MDTSTWDITPGISIHVAEYCPAMKQIHIMFSYSGAGIVNGWPFMSLPVEYRPIENRAIGTVSYQFGKNPDDARYQSIVQSEGAHFLARYALNQTTYGHIGDIRYQY